MDGCSKIFSQIKNKYRNIGLFGVIYISENGRWRLNMAGTTSVKLSELIKKNGLRNCTPNVDVNSIKITVPEINRPSLGLVGYFEHFPSERVQIVGYVEYTFIEQIERDVLVI